MGLWIFHDGIPTEIPPFTAVSHRCILDCRLTRKIHERRLFMPKRARFLVEFSFLVAVLPGWAGAGRLMCPENPNDVHHREILATSAPEVKARAALQDAGGHEWSKFVHPL